MTIRRSLTILLALGAAAQGCAVPGAESSAAGQQAEDPAWLPSYALAETVAQDYPAFLRGQRAGEDVLFSPARLRLWVEFFSNANTLYAVNNTVGAVAVGKDFYASSMPLTASIVAVGGCLLVSKLDGLPPDLQPRPWVAVLVGLLAVPMAPVAKDLVGFLNTLRSTFEKKART